MSNKKNDWKGMYQNLLGRLGEIDQYKKESSVFNEKVIVIERFHVLIAAVLVLITVIQAFLMIQQNSQIDQQNSLMQTQNILMQSQNSLMVADRQNSLVSLYSNVVDAIDSELKENRNTSKEGVLSSVTMGRIIALVNSFSPYEIEDNLSNPVDTLLLSPERGQILVTLIEANLSKETYDRIFTKANFEYSDLRRVNFDYGYLGNAKLNNSNFEYSSLICIDLHSSQLENCNFSACRFIQKSKEYLQEGAYKGADFSSSRLEGAVFKNARLSFATFSDAKIHKTSFMAANLNFANFEDAYPKLLACFDFANMCNTVFPNEVLSRSTFNKTSVNSDSLKPYLYNYRIEEKGRQKLLIKK